MTSNHAPSPGVRPLLPELREWLRVLGEVLDGVDIGMCAFDEDDRALVWNRSFLKLFPEHEGQVHEGEPYRCNLRRFYLSRLDAQELPFIDKHIESGIARHRGQSRPFEFEHRGRRIQASSLPMPGLGRIRVWRSAEPLPRHSVPAALPLIGGHSPQAQERGSYLLDNVPDALMICGRDGGIQWVNEAFVSMYGVSDVRTILGVCFESVYRAAWAGEANDEIARRDAGLAVLHEHLRFAGAPFEVPLPAGRWCRVVAQLAPGDTIFYALADISALKGVEAELRAAKDKLERHGHQLEELVEERTAELVAARDAAQTASRAKSAFLAMMSHELRTPLNGVIGMTALALRRTTDETAADYLGKAQTAAGHLADLISDILDLSKIEAGKLTLEHREFTLDSLLDGIRRLLEDRVREAGLQLVVDTQGTPILLTGDLTRLAQALVNYVGNAVKFTRQGGITLRSRLLEETEAGYLIRFEVEDTGIGIGPETLSRLFTSFEQADSSTTRQYGGTGLGLAITKRLAELMGGSAGVSSELGKGSTFWFTARLGKGQPSSPRAEEAGAVTAEEALRSRHLGTRILLVEDEPVNQELTCTLLEDAGLVVDIAGDGGEALRRASDQDYSVILMDMQMPVMNGLEATQRIRALPRHARTPIIAMTANAFAEDRDRCLAAGMNDFVAKPFMPDLFFATLLAALDADDAGSRPRA